MDYTEEKYRIGDPEEWSPKISQEEILSFIKESDFSQQQYDDGRDFCYFLKKVYYTDDTKNSEFCCMAYSVQQPGTLEFASVNEYVLFPSEVINFHRIAVLRDGEWIDKMNDTKFRVLDNEDQSIDGVLNSSKKVNITIKDVRLHDILILEDTKTLYFTEKDFLRKQLMKYIWISPDVYWGYGYYNFKMINNRSKVISYEKSFYRDAAGALIQNEKGEIPSGSDYSFELTNYLNPVDVNREVYSYIDFATKYTYNELLALVIPYYEAVLKEQPLGAYAGDLVEALDGFGEDLDRKVQYALEYVQNSVRYVFNEEEMHGHAPQSPVVTYASKQGDCKAKTVLLKAILDYLGVESDVVLVNYNADFYLDKYLPSLFNFNHVILRIKHNGVYYFEDATIKDEYGQLGTRSALRFVNYLPIKSGVTGLEQVESFKYADFAVYDKVIVDVNEDIAKITLRTVYKYARANGTRRYFKNTNKKVIIDHTNNFVYDCLDLGEKGYENDKRKIFVDPQISIISDDKVKNEITVEYTSTVNNPYILTASKQKVLKYYDSSIVKTALRDYVHQDLSFWQNYDSEKYEIIIKTDKPIDRNDAITIQELKLNNEYFSFSNKKNINKYEAIATIEFNPSVNIEVPISEIPQLRSEYDSVSKSNFGLGVILEKEDFLSSVMKFFKG